MKIFMIVGINESSLQLVNMKLNELVVVIPEICCIKFPKDFYTYVKRIDEGKGGGKEMYISSRSNLPILLLNEKGVVIAANPNAFQMLEYSESELYSLNFFSDILSSSNSLSAEDFSTLQDRESIETFLKFETNYSFCITRKCSIAHVIDHAGRKIYVVHGLKEESAVQDVEKTFFSIILHDTLGLSQKIISNLESIRSSDIPAEYASQLEKIIQIIDKHTYKMKKIGFLPYNEKKIDIRDAIEKLAIEYKIHPSKNVNISIKHEEKISAHIHPLFTKAIEIILDNAVGYAKDKNVEITIALKQEVDILKIIIIDKGIGIPPQYRERIFKKYYRIPGVGKGSGIGLFLAKKIVEMFKGTIKVKDRVKNQPSQGTKFIIELPYHGLPAHTRNQ